MEAVIYLSGKRKETRKKEMTSEQSLSENPSSFFSEKGHLTLNDHRARSPAVDVVVSPFVSITCVCLCQIAPAENPDVTERMVIITGTPEAQFKVKKTR